MQKLKPWLFVGSGVALFTVRALVYVVLHTLDHR